jgi:hypothetical protein
MSPRCRRWDLNLHVHGQLTGPSSRRVCQFGHPGTGEESPRWRHPNHASGDLGMSTAPEVKPLGSLSNHPAERAGGWHARGEFQCHGTKTRGAPRRSREIL